MKIYRATLEVATYFAAADDASMADLIDAGRDAIAEEMDENGYMLRDDVSVDAHRPLELRHVPEAWRDSIPRGDMPTERTIRQILEAERAGRGEG